VTSSWSIFIQLYERAPCYQGRITEKHPEISLQCLWRFCDQKKHHCLLDKKVTASEKGKEEFPDFPHLVHPVTAVSPELLQGDIICEDQ